MAKSKPRLRWYSDPSKDPDYPFARAIDSRQRQALFSTAAEPIAPPVPSAARRVSWGQLKVNYGPRPLNPPQEQDQEEQ